MNILNHLCLIISNMEKNQAIVTFFPLIEAPSHVDDYKSYFINIQALDVSLTHTYTGMHTHKNIYGSHHAFFNLVRHFRELFFYLLIKE